MASSTISIRTRIVQSCPICRHSGRILHDSVTDRAYGVPGQWQILQCSECHSGWLNPVPLPDDLGRCYSEGYYTHDAPEGASMGSSKVIAFLRGAVLSVQKGYTHLQPKNVWAPAVGWLSSLVPPIRRRASFNMGSMLIPFRKGGRLLEIGCGGGSYLALMQMLGWKVYGIEPDPVAADVAAKATGGVIHKGVIEDAPFETGSFDAIVTNHVIEHVYDPNSFVSSAGRLLAKGGRLAIQTPNFSSLGHKMFGADLYSLDAPRHLCLFTPQSLRKLVEMTGLFHRIEVSTPTATSPLAIRRAQAVRQTGNFLDQANSSGLSQCADVAFRASEAIGNRLFHWGEEIRCTAVRT